MWGMIAIAAATVFVVRSIRPRRYDVNQIDGAFLVQALKRDTKVPPLQATAWLGRADAREVHHVQ